MDGNRGSSIPGLQTRWHKNFVKKMVQLLSDALTIISLSRIATRSASVRSREPQQWKSSGIVQILALAGVSVPA